MKKYTNPTATIALIDTADVITTSWIAFDEGGNGGQNIIDMSKI